MTDLHAALDKCMLTIGEIAQESGVPFDLVWAWASWPTAEHAPALEPEQHEALLRVALSRRYPKRAFGKRDRRPPVRIKMIIDAMEPGIWYTPAQLARRTGGQTHNVRTGLRYLASLDQVICRVVLGGRPGQKQWRRHD